MEPRLWRCSRQDMFEAGAQWARAQARWQRRRRQKAFLRGGQNKRMGGDRGEWRRSDGGTVVVWDMVR